MKVKSGDKIVSREHPIIQKKVNESLKRSITEGSYAASSTGFGASYFTPYALALNATSSHIGLLNGLLNLVPGFIQLWAARFVEKHRRKKIAIIATILQALVFIPLIFLGLFFSGLHYAVWIAMGLICLFYIFGAAVGPAWFSWMGSLVPEDKRGKYFSKRNKITGFFGLVSMIIGALILDRFRKSGIVLLGFGVLFTLAFFSRLIATMLFLKQYEPRLKIHKKDYFSFKQFLKKSPETPFGRFTIFTALMRIATNIAGPFFAVYMLKDLGFSYVWFMAVIVSGTVFHLLFLPAWGKFSDRFGNIKLLRIACGGFLLSPFLWILSAYLPLSVLGVKIYLLIVPQIVGGFAWAGFFLASNNYIYDSVRQEKRNLGIAYFNLVNGIGLFLGAMIGSLIAVFDITFMNKLLFIFLVSGIARILLFSIDSRFLREVRYVKKFSSQFMIKEFNPAEGFIREFHKLNNKGVKIIHHIKI